MKVSTPVNLNRAPVGVNITPRLIIMMIIIIIIILIIVIIIIFIS